MPLPCSICSPSLLLGQQRRGSVPVRPCRMRASSGEGARDSAWAAAVVTPQGVASPVQVPWDSSGQGQVALRASILGRLGHSYIFLRPLITDGDHLQWAELSSRKSNFTLLTCPSLKVKYPLTGCCIMLCNFSNMFIPSAYQEVLSNPRLLETQVSLYLDWHLHDPITFACVCCISPSSLPSTRPGLQSPAINAWWKSWCTNI